MVRYDFVLVGAGLFSATLAYLLTNAGKTCLIVQKRPHIGGNIYTQQVQGIILHKYGAHIFHTDSIEVWQFVNKFAHFNTYINTPLSCVGGKMYNLPFNMHTFSQVWNDVTTPSQAIQRISKQSIKFSNSTPSNLQEQALSLVGKDLYKLFIEGYTEKQWGCSCKDLPPQIIKRIPLRFTYNNNYFNDMYQGIPVEGYTKMVYRMLEKVDVWLNFDYIDQRDYINRIANKIIYTGEIDRFFDYCYGRLGYRSLKFDTSRILSNNAQGTSVINYPEKNVEFTRSIQHKHFYPENKYLLELPYTYVTKQYPITYGSGVQPYYPINGAQDRETYSKYFDLIKRQRNVFFGGRLGSYKYFDMDDTILSAFQLFKKVQN